jgi:hypothetical protein
MLNEQNNAKREDLRYMNQFGNENFCITVPVVFSLQLSFNLIFVQNKQFFLQIFAAGRLRKNTKNGSLDSTMV